ncbi:SusC/RagA family TonB-linked outer membrane protein [Formosa sp. S-31]|uniref:SusC/RagA family TonB-linked outer membrane protein n=1 Tax=Formosa sp. S-31 TaxID=2790949 RepID=UPI003EBCD4AC
MKLKKLFNSRKSAFQECSFLGRFRLFNLVMIFILASITNLSASNDTITVTYTGKQVPLKTVFNEIKKQTGYSVVCSSQLLKKSKPVSIKADRMPLNSFLKNILRGQPFDYTIENTTIFISLKETSDTGKLYDAQVFNKEKNGYEFKITGRFIDYSGVSIPGVTVYDQDLGKGISSDENGNFSLMVKNGNKIQISSIGFQGLTIEVSKIDSQLLRVNIISSEASEGNNVTSKVEISSNEMLMFTLANKIETLTEVIINAGYYSVNQRVATGSISSINEETIEKQPVTSLIQALEGTTPGLYIQQTSGMPGAGLQVKVRGASSLRAGTLPLYIIDGVPFNGASIDAQDPSATRMSGAAVSGVDPFSMLNPNDIESLEVLKDADATAIYGSRGANGVILITTKKGKSGKPKFTLNTSTGVGSLTSVVPTLSTKDYLELRRQTFANDGITPDEFSAPDITLWDQNADIDFQKKLMGNTANRTDISGSLSGGSGGTNFLLSGSFHKETPVTPGDSRYIRGSLNMNVNYTSPDEKLKTNLSTIYSADDNLIYGTDYTSDAYQLPGNYPIYDSTSANGLYYDFNYSNPIAFLKQSFSAKSNNLVLNATVAYNITSAIEAKVSMGLNKVELVQTNLTPSDVYPPIFQAMDMGTYLSNSSKVYIVEPQINFNKQIGESKLSGVIGGTYQATNYNQPYFVIAADFASQSLMQNYTSANTIFVNSNTSSEYKYTSVFGQANYNFKDKYIINGTFRRDGSSKFGPSNRFGNFGSIAAAWIFTEENFLKNNTWLSFGKIRGSYGITGNDQIGNYGYLDTYSLSNYSYGSTKGFVPSRIANSDYSWEKAKKLEVATELGFLNNKLMLNLAWYRNKTSNLLVAYPLSTQTGFSSYNANFDAVLQSQGVEADLSAKLITNKDFNWSMNFNFTTYKNKLVEYPDLLSSSYANTYVLGESLNLAVGYHFLGMENGVATVEDVNKDGVISPGISNNGFGDYKVLGTLDPKFYGGLNNSFTYKNWQLDFLFNFVNKKGYELTRFPGMLGNIPDYALDLGFTPTTDSSSESYASYRNYYMQSDAIFKDASFVRLRNLSISYSLPESWLQQAKISKFRIYAQGQNLLTFTSYRGLDPETTGNYNVNYGFFSPTMPPLKVVSLGIDISL